MKYIFNAELLQKRESKNYWNKNVFDISLILIIGIIFSFFIEIIQLMLINYLTLIILVWLFEVIRIIIVLSIIAYIIKHNIDVWKSF